MRYFLVTVLSIFCLISCTSESKVDKLIIGLERDVAIEHCKIVPAHTQSIIMIPDEITICTISKEKSYDEKAKLWGYDPSSELHKVSGSTAEKLIMLVLDPMSNELIRENYERRKKSILNKREDLSNEFWVKECLFDPGFAIRFKDDEGFIDCLICLGCNQWQFFYEGRGFQRGNIDGIEDKLKKILK
ncbi:MAG: hypothetical protein NE330_01610, partial [Lentisphaeraceae bacterium]|nr:hypothetical protein [Lentisphaeraceae bacterium]